MQIISAQGRTLTIDLLNREESNRGNHPRNRGKITVQAEESVSSKTTVEMILSCTDLEYKDLFSRSVRTTGFEFLPLFLSFPFLVSY